MNGENRRSEFGKGLVICLVKFAEHFMTWPRTSQEYTDINLPLSRAVEIHFSAASDHLYEIEVPEDWRHTEIAEKVTKLQSRALVIGHSFTNKQWTEQNVEDLHSLCREIAMLIDKQLGLEPDIGEW